MIGIFLRIYVRNQRQDDTQEHDRDRSRDHEASRWIRSIVESLDGIKYDPMLPKDLQEQTIVQRKSISI